MAKMNLHSRQTAGDRVMDAVIIILLTLMNIVMLYPFIYVISTSISDPSAVIMGKVFLWPVGFDLNAFRTMVLHPLFMTAYGNTVLYAVSGTFLTLLLTSLAAYPLSLDRFQSRKWLTVVYTITMFFSGGMIPTYLIIKQLHLLNTRWALILPGVVSAWNLIIMRSFFKTIPESMSESAYLDGANEWTIWLRIILPLSTPVLATIGLFTMVYYWNDFFSALLYTNDSGMYPVQMILRMILTAAQTNAGEKNLIDLTRAVSTQSLKSAAIVVTILPIMCVYPFIQRFFVKGMMIGAVKG